MKQYKLWIRLNQIRTTYTMLFASNDLEAKALGEAQFGIGNVLGYWRMTD